MKNTLLTQYKCTNKIKRRKIALLTHKNTFCSSTSIRENVKSKKLENKTMVLQ